jgi:hypothetical protein
MPFTLSIEETEGKSRQHGFHLGTDERVARIIVQDKMAAFIDYGMPIVTMALMRDGRIVDVLYPDLTWQSCEPWVDDQWCTYSINHNR